MSERKVIQVSAYTTTIQNHDGNCSMNHCVVALCDDGTMWRRAPNGIPGTYWERIPDVPPSVSS